MSDTYEPDALIEQVIGAAIEVHSHLGAGFSEEKYQRAMEIELGLRGIRFAAQRPVSLDYKLQSIGDGKLDLFVEDRLVVELKACEANPQKFRRQVVCYLKAMKLPLGLVINFDVDLLKQGVARVVVKENRPS